MRTYMGLQLSEYLDNGQNVETNSNELNTVVT